MTSMHQDYDFELKYSKEIESFEATVALVGGSFAVSSFQKDTIQQIEGVISLKTTTVGMSACAMGQC